MTRRRRLRRRLLWAGVLAGLVFLLATVSVLRAMVWVRDEIASAGSRTIDVGGGAGATGAVF
jgi:hypothetical protein